jgi:hypothetical protein
VCFSAAAAVETTHMRDLHEGRGGVVATVAGSAALSIAGVDRTVLLDRSCRSTSATGVPVDTTCPTRTTGTAQLRATGEGEAERLRPPSARATMAAARAVVVPSAREADGAGAADEVGHALGRGTPMVLVLPGVHVPKRRLRVGRGTWQVSHAQAWMRANIHAGQPAEC